MAPNSIFDKNDTDIPLANIQAAVGKINALLHTKLKKTIFRDMLVGFKALLESVTRKEANAFETFILWLQLFLKMQSALDPKDENLREQFEKIVPPAVTYIIGCLQNKSPNMPTFHYELLEMTLKLLSNVKPITVEKLANIETGIIACLWFPVDFVGDFNTQLLALRLLTKLLKYVDDIKLQNELDKIQCPQKDLLREKLNRAISVVNYHEGIFENIARNILNNYNMNMAKNVLVYSFRCKTVHFGEQFEFFKALNADKFWVDLNYCPRTITFNARYRENKQAEIVDVSVSCFVRSIQLEQTFLTVQFKPPMQLSKKLNNFMDLENISRLQLELPVEEALRLGENCFVLEYYNMQQEPVVYKNLIKNNELVSKNHESNEIGHENNRKNNTGESLLFEKAATLQNPINANFQESYDFLIHSNSNEKHICEEAQKQLFELTTSSAQSISESTYAKSSSSHKNKKILRKSKLIRNQSKLSKQIKPAKNSTCSMLSQLIPTESPKTSRHSQPCLDAHPINELRAKRRFFKTAKRNWDVNTKDNSKTSNTCRTKRASRKNTKSSKLPPPPRPKQINKVKPMTHLDKKNDDIMNNEATQESQENSGIINITNFLDNGHESATVFNEVQGSIEVQNVSRITTGLANSARAAVPNTLATVQVEPPSTADVYENPNVSDAEPGQSYRAFRTRHHIPKNAFQQKNVLQNPKPKTAVIKKRRMIEKCQNIDENVASTSKAAAAATNTTTIRKLRKRTKTKSEQSNKTANNELRDNSLLSSPAKIPRLTSANENNTVYSADIEIDLTCSPPHTRVTTTHNALNCKMASNASVRTSGQRPLSPFVLESDDDAILSTINKNVEDILHNIYQEAKPTEDYEIQECRHNVPSELSPALSCLNTTNPGINVKSASIDIPEPVPIVDLSDVAVVTNVDRMVEPIHIPADKPSLHRCSGNAQTTRTMEKQPTNEKLLFEENECILYHERSDSSAESEYECDTKFDSTQSAESIYSTPEKLSVRNVATTTITERQVTAISTSIVTRHTRLVSMDVFAIPTTGAPTPSAPPCVSASNDVEQIAYNATLAAAMEDHTSTTTCRYDDIALTPISLKRETLNIIETYKEDLAVEYESLVKQVKEKCVDAFVKKVSDISECILNEAKKEREELEELELVIERIVRQLESQYESYQKKSEKFKCFRENIDNLLQALSKMNVSDEIDREFDQLLKKIQTSSREKSAKQWREFVQESTKNLVKNLSEISNL